MVVANVGVSPIQSVSAQSLPVTSPAQTSPQLSLRVACAANSQIRDRSFIAHQYASYPFRLSNALALAPDDPQRVYAYIMNAGPGLLAGDDLRMGVEVCDRASLYLTDQSATKVHSKPTGAPSAQVHCDLKVGRQAYLEYVLEPIILFPAAALKQTTQIHLHAQAHLVLSEIVVPGRLAKGEFYVFDSFESRLQVRSPEGVLQFTDTQKLLGQSNPFRTHCFLTDYPVLGNFLIISPDLDLAQLSQLIHATDVCRNIPGNTLQIGSSPLPNCHGLFVRAMATQASVLKYFQHHVLSIARQLLNQPPLPQIPK